MRHWCGFVLGVALLVLHKITFCIYDLGGMPVFLFALCIVVEFCFYKQFRFSKLLFSILIALYGIMAISFLIFQIIYFARGYVSSLTVPGIVTIVTFTGKTAIGIVDLVRSIGKKTEHKNSSQLTAK